MQGTVTVLDSGAITYTRVWCVFEVFKSLMFGMKFLYDVVTARRHFLVQGAKHLRSAATILDRLAVTIAPKCIFATLQPLSNERSDDIPQLPSSVHTPDIA